MPGLKLAGRTVRGARVKVNVLDGLHEVLHHGVMVEGLPSATNGIQVRVRLRAARHEQRAAVRSGLSADVIRPDPAGTIDDLDLVSANERAKHRDLGNVVSCRDVIERLGGHLSERLTGDEPRTGAR